MIVLPDITKGLTGTSKGLPFSAIGLEPYL